MTETNAPLTNSPPHKPPTKGELLRANVTHWARWGITNRAQFHYTQGAQRDDFLLEPVGTLPVYTDCSGFVTLCFKWGGCKDPNGLGYRRLGYTGTLLAHGNHIATAIARTGDVFVFGANPGLHAALIIDAIGDGDYWLSSHGHEDAPNRVRFSDMDAYFNHVHQALRWLG